MTRAPYLWLLAALSVFGLLMAGLASAVVRKLEHREFTVYETVDGPGETKLSAVLYEIHGGATEPFYRFLALYPVGTTFDPEKARAVFLGYGRLVMRPEWKDATTLVVHVPAKAEVISAAQPDNGIRIEYPYEQKP